MPHRGGPAATIAVRPCPWIGHGARPCRGERVTGVSTRSVALVTEPLVSGGTAAPGALRAPILHLVTAALGSR